MDPYVKIRLGGREFRTQVMTNAGKKAKFHWAQMIDWRGEPDIHFLAMDSNILVADGLIGETVYKGLPLHSDFEGPCAMLQPPVETADANTPPRCIQIPAVRSQNMCTLWRDGTVQGSKSTGSRRGTIWHPPRGCLGHLAAFSGPEMMGKHHTWKQPNGHGTVLRVPAFDACTFHAFSQETTRPHMLNLWQLSSKTS